MTGRAKPLTTAEQCEVMAYLAAKRPKTFARDWVAILLSFRSGLRVSEIAALLPSDITTASGEISANLLVRRLTSKGKRISREVPIHPELREALIAFMRVRERSETLLGTNVRRLTVWFHELYARVGFVGASSHSGRRSFATKAARQAGQIGASIVDVQQLLGHARLQTTCGYVDPCDDGRGRLVMLAG